MTLSNMCPVSMYCPNCGRKLTGYRGEDLQLRLSCPRCSVRIWSKQCTRCRIKLELTLIH